MASPPTHSIGSSEQEVSLRDGGGADANLSRRHAWRQQASYGADAPAIAIVISLDRKLLGFDRSHLAWCQTR
jgi:hypothetical protein